MDIIAQPGPSYAAVFPFLFCLALPCSFHEAYKMINSFFISQVKKVAQGEEQAASQSYAPPLSGEPCLRVPLEVGREGGERLYSWLVAEQRRNLTVP